MSNPIHANGAALAEFLNTSTNAGRMRILHILGLLKTAEEFKSVDVPAWEPIDGDSGASVLAASDWPGFQSFYEVNEALKRYRQQVWLEGPTTERGVRSQLQYDTSEDQAAHGLISLTEAGKLAFLRACPVCNEWFYASRKDQQKCDKSCRRGAYRSTPFYKARARIQGRITYWEGKRKNAITPKAKAKVREKIDTARSEMQKLKTDRS